MIEKKIIEMENKFGPDRNQEFQDIVMHMATKFINIPDSNFDLFINSSLKTVGEFIQTDRVYVFMYYFDKNIMDNTFEWCNQGIEPEINNLQNIPLSDFLDNWVNPHSQGKFVHVEDVSKLPKDGSLYSILSMQNIKSVLTIPMFNQNQCLGFVGFDSVKQAKRFNDREIKLLQVVAELITNSLIRRKQQLSILNSEILLNQTKQNFETFFNRINDFLFVLDEQGNIIHFNRTVLERLGYSSEELMGKSILFVHPFDRRDEANRIVGEMLMGTADFCPVPLVTKDGKHIQVETRVIRGFWDGKSVLFGVTKDISLLKLSEEKYSKTFQLNPSACALCNSENGRYIELNEAFFKLLGFNKNEAIGKTPLELGLWTPNQFKIISKKTNQLHNVSELETIIKAKNGDLKNVLLSSETIFLNNKKYEYYVFEDFTERKMMADRLRENNEKARDLAISSNLAKSQFVSNVSHEIRTPLTGIFNSMYLLNNTKLSFEQQEYLNIAQSSLDSLYAIVNNVLDLSKIEAKKLELTTKIANLETELVQIAKNQKYTAFEKGISFFFEYDYSIPENLFIDTNRLRQILLNLLNNAIKYTDKGSVSFKVRLIEKIGNFVNVDFSIVDTGIGIPSEKIPFLTDKFYQIDPIEPQKRSGSGLGLSIANGLIRLMGGQLIIKSQFGKGSEFSFTLPIKLAEFSKPEVDNKTISREVLIVHGPKEDLRFLNNIFKLMNMVVSTVSINEVLKIDIKKHPFDLMVFFPGELTPSLDLIKWASSIKIPKILMMRQHSEFILKEWNNLNISNVFLIPFTRKAFQDEMFSKNRTLKTGDTDKEKVVSSGYRLLVIDDNKINRQSLAIILNKAGFMTSTARNGLEALDLIKENDYDLILLDIKMPVMDGYQLAKAIRKMGGKYLDILIIALTANAIKSVFEEAISAGMNGMISKPVQPEALLKTIESHLQKNQTREKIDLSFIQIPNELVVFDTTNFLGRFGDSKNLVIELATAYLEDYHADLKKIEKAILAQDIKGIDDTIHYFIGSCSNVGAERLLWVAKTIKNEAKNGILLSMKALYRMMDQEAEKFAGTFSDWLEERKRSL